MNLKERRRATHQAAQNIIDGAKAERRELTKDEAEIVEKLIAQVKEFDRLITELAATLGSSEEEPAAPASGPSDEEKARGDALLAKLDGMGGAKSVGKYNPLTGKFESKAQAMGNGIMDLSAKGLRGIAREATGNAVFGTTALGQKALVTAGQSITAIPMLPDVVNTGRPPASLLDVLRSRTTATPTWQYLRQIGRDSNAAFVAPGGVKPTSDFSTETVDNQLRVLAHISGPVDKYVLGDAPALERFLVDEMNYGIRQALEAQVVGGNGTAPNLRGLLNTSGIQTQTFETDVLTTTRAAITAVETLGLAPDLFVIHPSDWEALELLRQSNGDLDLGHLPIDRAARRLWGVQVVVSTAPGAGNALLLDSTSVELVTDGSISVEWSDAVSDDFERNQKRVRVEGRFALDVFRPLGVVKIDTAAA
ncbi:phage major capsid protein [Rhodococcus pyridinivorans]|uniref:phage major capsid protein n=1 Tax=Rhodococcus pyridinivorans TaxID=103816 RepID=UPI00110E58B7|nr:phage major capsid protein [Rhodococcus pyridinivorans]